MADGGHWDTQPGVAGARAATVAPARVLRVRLLGGFDVSFSSDETIPDSLWRLQKAKSVIKLLALAPGHRMRREQLMELLWPELESDAAANNLYYALHVARRALTSTGGPPGIHSQTLRLHQHMVSLEPISGLWVDAETFESAAAAAMRADDLDAYTSALDLYTGDLLPEDRYDDWATGRREALRETYLRLLLTSAQLHTTQGDSAAAIEALLRALAADPTREEAALALMRVYAASGQRQAALRQYTLLADALQRELDSEPDRETQRLFQRIRDGQFAPTPTA
ncbi:MAG TPA: BTAD domain-containing putative transcriptional regulator, partial [Ktedonobacterales bacterium]|nr:BTAD domain-containing putative transcriptional regulator [Ktedonobacterales bacterium]